MAIIYVSINGFIDKVPVKEVRNFEKDFTTILNAQHKETLNAIRSGKIDDSITSVLKKVALELAKKY